jgi:CO dehydrogenase maturation factor
MKIAVSGKGGVGKTTLSAFLIKAFSDRGHQVLAIDADPDANLAGALGFDHPEAITPISEMKDLIGERTESQPGSFGTFFKLNPHVSDLPEKLSKQKGNIRLMVMGGVKRGGSGCICPESVMLKTLITHLILVRDEVVVLDMEAGIEHLGRGTASAVNKLIVVVEPGKRSIETARHIQELARDIGLKNIALVGNKIRGDQDKIFLQKELQGFHFLGFLPYDPQVIEADLEGKAPFEKEQGLAVQVGRIVDDLIAENVSNAQ